MKFDTGGALKSDTDAIKGDTEALIVDVAAVKTDTEAILVDTAAIQAETDKIDSAVTDGLAGTHNSLAYRAHEIEKHIHNRELWYGKSAADNYFDPASLISWQLVAGAGDAYGNPVQLSDGDEVEGGSATKKYDLHRMMICAANTGDALYKVQFLYGTGVVGDAAILTDAPFIAPAIAGVNSLSAGPVDIIAPRITCNNKLWAKVACVTDAATIDFVVGLHVYEA
jgi:hypothetical protein